MHDTEVLEQTATGEAWRVRRATLADLPVLLTLRRDLFVAMGDSDPVKLEQMVQACARYWAEALPAERFLGWVAEVEGEVVATGGLVVREFPPTVRNMAGRDGYIMSMYTRPEWRRQGIARSILRAIIDYLREAGVPRASLHATEEGRPLYLSEGFQSTDELRLWVEPDEG